MRRRQGRLLRAGGFTLFELIIVIVVVALLSGGLLRRFVSYEEMAEKAAMEQTAGAVRSALTIQLAALIARGRLDDAPKLVAINPMKLLTDQQKNYAGEFYAPKPGDILPGSWYYDLKARELVYRVEHDEHFRPRGNGGAEIRYKSVLVYHEPIGTGADAPTGGSQVAGVTLKAVSPYTWKLKP